MAVSIFILRLQPTSSNLLYAVAYCNSSVSPAHNKPASRVCMRLQFPFVVSRTELSQRPRTNLLPSHPAATTASPKTYRVINDNPAHDQLPVTTFPASLPTSTCTTAMPPQPVTLSDFIVFPPMAGQLHTHRTFTACPKPALSVLPPQICTSIAQNCENPLHAPSTVPAMQRKDLFLQRLACRLLGGAHITRAQPCASLHNP